jgi:5-methylcytosine-specific restriction endonuclease McrA
MLCRKGHRSKRYASGDCIKCAKERAARWQKDNPKKVAIRNKRWRDKNKEHCRNYWAAYNKANPHIARESSRRYKQRYPEKIKASIVQWRKNNKQHIRLYKKTWNKNNPDKVKTMYRNWALKNKDKIKAWRDSWRENNKEQMRSLIHRYKMKKKNARGIWSAEDVFIMMKKQKELCNGCSKNIKTGYQIDHKNPISRGGSNYPRNLQLLCKSCNSEKHNKTVREWKAYRMKKYA